jgi:hypothetical protein
VHQPTKPVRPRSLEQLLYDPGVPDDLIAELLGDDDGFAVP